MWPSLVMTCSSRCEDRGVSAGKSAPGTHQIHHVPQREKLGGGTWLAVLRGLRVFARSMTKIVGQIGEKVEEALVSLGGEPGGRAFPAQSLGPQLVELAPRIIC